jgi:hypothetical protein
VDSPVSSSPVVQAILRAVPRLPRPAKPPLEQHEWWDRGVLDGVETIKVFAQEALATIDSIAAEEGATAARRAIAEFGQLFATSGPRRPDGRLDEVWILHVADRAEAP